MSETSQSAARDPVCEVKVTFEAQLAARLATASGRPVDRTLLFDRRRGFYVGSEVTAEAGAVDVLELVHDVAEHDLERIPADGPLILVANHPFGGVEGLVLATLLRSVRPDVKVVADGVLETCRAAEGPFLVEDPLDDGAAGPLAQCVDWVRNGGALVVFPARGVARVDLKQQIVFAPEWRPGIARIVRAAEAPVVPVYFSGGDGALFEILDLVNYRLRPVVDPQALFNRRRKEVEIRVGSPVPFRKFETLRTDQELTAYLHLRTHILGSRTPSASAEHSRAADAREEGFEPVARPLPRSRVLADVRRLPPDRTLATMGEFSALIAAADEIPNVLHEIGRLREITFREVREGSGRPIDLDRFDRHYHHLFVWNTEKDELVGAYRLGLTDEILAAHGESGLYTTTLFRFGPGTFQKMSSAVELGRSFVRQEYQRTYVPLMLLWKGLSRFCYLNPRYRLLFGPVSINDQYNSTSRQMMIRFLEQNNPGGEVADLVEPRTPLKAEAIHGIDPETTAALIDNLEDLSALVSDIEADRKGVPILLKQYLKLGGRLLGCNIDPDFSNVLDALLLVDLTEVPVRILSRYMGRAETLEYRAHHGVAANA